jgi:hypothetical protein
MKGKAIARQGFSDVYEEDNRNGFSRPHVSIDWRKQSASAPVLRARSTQLLSQETAQVVDSHPCWVCSTVRQLKSESSSVGNADK